MKPGPCVLSAAATIVDLRGRRDAPRGPDGRLLPAAVPATHCARGHALVGRNLIAYSGRRRCRLCKRNSENARRAAGKREPVPFEARFGPKTTSDPLPRHALTREERARGGRSRQQRRRAARVASLPQHAPDETRAANTGSEGES